MGELPERFFSRCMRWSEEIVPITDSASRIDYFHKVLPELLLDRGLFGQILENIVNGGPCPDARTATMFPNEIILFQDPGREYSVRMYLWGHGESDPVHDHNSWGVIGAVSGAIEVAGYQRIDDGSDEYRALLKQTGRILVPAGKTCSVLMLNKGIHKTGNADSSAIVQVSVYGRNLTGRNYVNIYDPGTGMISRLCSQQIRKRLLARDALQGLTL
jgi:predicted metal-dependent enzyme (double-stranded beta helix superfamily)